MSDKPQGADDIAFEVFRHELKASELMTRLFDENSPEECEQAIADTLDLLVENTDDVQQIRRIVLLSDQLGSNLGSQLISKKVELVVQQTPELDFEEPEHNG